MDNKITFILMFLMIVLLIFYIKFALAINEFSFDDKYEMPAYRMGYVSV